MSKNKSKRLTGRILLVQEDRFRMMGESGRSYLLTLSSETAISPEDLERWHNQGARLMVEYEGEGPEQKPGEMR